MVGFSDASITFDANNIWGNWNGLSFTADTVVGINVNDVPEPSGLALLGLAVAGLGFARRKSA